MMRRAEAPGLKVSYPDWHKQQLLFPKRVDCELVEVDLAPLGAKKSLRLSPVSSCLGSCVDLRRARRTRPCAANLLLSVGRLMGCPVPTRARRRQKNFPKAVTFTTL